MLHQVVVLNQRWRGFQSCFAVPYAQVNLLLSKFCSELAHACKVHARASFPGSLALDNMLQLLGHQVFLVISLSNLFGGRND